MLSLGARSAARGRRARIFMAAAALVASSCASASADQGDAAGNLAREAFVRGDYDGAEAGWKPLAERGDAGGELGLGEVYEQGKGDYEKAESWYKKSAEQNNSEAAYRLALVAAAGNATTAPDFVKAYMWTTIAAANGDNWGERAKELRQLLDAHVSASDRGEGVKEAAAWRDRPKGGSSAPAPAGPVYVGPPLPAVAGAKDTGGCPGWPFKDIPCRDKLPPIPGQGQLPSPIQAPEAQTKVAVAVPPPMPAPPPAPGTPPVQLDEALHKIDCASLHELSGSRGAREIVGTIPDEADRARVIAVAKEVSPNSPLSISVHVMPAPLCRSLVAFDEMRRSGLVQKTPLDAHLYGGSTQLQEGDPIRIEVKGGERTLNVRIDYFALDGQVLHMWPGPDEAVPKVPPGAIKVFGENGDVKAGGAPFGTEFIAVTASAAPLDLTIPAGGVEQAADYLDRLQKALRRAQTGGGGESMMETVVVQTHGKP